MYKKFRLIFLVTLILITLNGCVNAKKIDYIELDKANFEEIFNIEEFKLTDIWLIVYYTDGSNKSITLNESMLTNDDLDKLTKIGNHQVTATYRGHQVVFDVQLVLQATSIEIIADTIPVNYTVKEFKLEDIKLKVSYQNSAPEIINLDSGMLTPTDLSKLTRLGKHTITVKYLGQTTSFSIILLDNEPVFEDPNLIDRRIVLYAKTTANATNVVTKFAITGKGAFSSFQFKILIDKNITIQNISPNSQLIGLLEYDYQEEYIIVTYTQDTNQSLELELFTIEFTSNVRFGNFVIDHNFDNLFFEIVDNRIVQVTSIYYMLYQ